ncbi:MAG: family 43 glycosylhydrolase [Oscillospiraceae bacterium]|nr:family 43 glycosylhydrolase [Oscillospiraceae bacterium]
MIFCHEWMQTVDGEMCAIRLKKDLTASVGEPILLFTASAAEWTVGSNQTVNGEEKQVFVTDGPYPYRTSEGKLFLLWSSGGEEGYAIGIAESLNGDIDGKWIHQKELLFKKDGGHGMIFTDLNGSAYVTLHSPNHTPNERPCFFPIEEKNGTIVLK